MQDDGQGGLLIGQRVTDALCSIVRGLEASPSWLVAKGGITSNDIAVEALGVKRALVIDFMPPPRDADALAFDADQLTRMRSPALGVDRRATREEH